MRAAEVNEITSNTMCVDTNGLAKDYLRCGRKTAVDIGTSAPWTERGAGSVNRTGAERQDTG